MIKKQITVPNLSEYLQFRLAEIEFDEPVLASEILDTTIDLSKVKIRVERDYFLRDIADDYPQFKKWYSQHKSLIEGVFIIGDDKIEIHLREIEDAPDLD